MTLRTNKTSRRTTKIHSRTSSPLLASSLVRRRLHVNVAQSVAPRLARVLYLVATRAVPRHLTGCLRHVAPYDKEAPPPHAVSATRCFWVAQHEGRNRGKMVYGTPMAASFDVLSQSEFDEEVLAEIVRNLPSLSLVIFSWLSARLALVSPGQQLGDSRNCVVLLDGPAPWRRGLPCWPFCWTALFMLVKAADRARLLDGACRICVAWARPRSLLSQPRLVSLAGRADQVLPSVPAARRSL